MFRGVDFYSDTLTKPTEAMRKAIAQAEVGDEQKGEDPTTLKLEEKMAEILGFSAVIFLPSATMANQIAIRSQCEPGDEVIAWENAHIFLAEAGGPAVHSGVLAKPIHSKDGVFSAEDVKAAYRSIKGAHYPVSRLVCVENTTNMGGGVAWPKEKLDAVITASKEFGLRLHLDGSRLFNASIAAGLSLRELAASFDTVTICLSKGLGCPAGAILAFDKNQYLKIRRLKQLMGGSLRQSGILAAAGLYALDHHVVRLQEDHDNAARFARFLQDLDAVVVENPLPSTNMVYFGLRNSKIGDRIFLNRCEELGIRFSHVGENRFRAVTHLDIKKVDIERAITVLKEVFKSV